MVIHKSQLLIFLIVVLLDASEGSRRSRKSKNSNRSLPKYEIFPSTNIPSDLQVTTFLYKGETKSLFYNSSVENGPLSFTITTCSSPIHWRLDYIPNNITAERSYKIYEGVTKDDSTKHLVSFVGLYTFHLVALEKGSYVHIYLSTENEGPQAIQNAVHQKLRLMKRQRRGKLTVRWEPSMVDPQSTDYCLVVNTDKYYKTLCSAQSEIFGLPTPLTDGRLTADSQTITAWQPPILDVAESNSYPLIACTGRKTHYTLSNLKQGQSYYFNVFAINKISNLTYLYGSTLTKFNKRVKHIPLKEGKSTFVNLKQTDGEAILRFKVGKRIKKPVAIYVMPCGTAVDVDITMKGKNLGIRQRIERFGKLVIPSPIAGARYNVRIYSVNRDDDNTGTGVELYATTKSSAKIPVPNMPENTTVEEYPSLRRCDSVTIAWLPSRGLNVARYCFVIKEGKLRDAEEYGIRNECGLENRLKKSIDFVLKYCKDMVQDDKTVLTERINHLHPGKSYYVQVTVKKPKGKTLSYDLIQVYTTPSCHKDLS